MFETLKNAWRIADIRKKILFTVLIIFIFRVGMAIPVPFVSAEALKAWFDSANGSLFSFLDMMSGGGLSQASLFALSITPYINASIIIQLLAIGIPALERLAKEEDGRQKIAAITRYSTVVISLLMAFAYYVGIKNMGALTRNDFFGAAVIMLTFIAGSMFTMWLGEQNNEKGIGNGISVLLFAGIISRGPAIIQTVIQISQPWKTNWYIGIIVLIVAVLLVLFIVLLTEGERRLPVQYAKKVVGRKMYGGQSTYIPLKVNMTGVLPIIFAQSLLSIPQTIALAFPNIDPASFGGRFIRAFYSNSWLYAVLYFLLIVFFNYFYTTVQFNPIEVSNNIKRNGGFIPGIRPGKPTSDYIAKVLSKITLIGAVGLAVVALVPISSSWFGIGAIGIGGTSLIIVVGVAIELYQQLESQMLMRHYKGFLD